jgi:hypothetical protein
LLISIKYLVKHLLNRISCCCDGSQDRIFLPVLVRHSAEVETQVEHGKDNNGPEDSSKNGLVVKEDVDETLEITIKIERQTDKEKKRKKDRKKERTTMIQKILPNMDW